MLKKLFGKKPGQGKVFIIPFQVTALENSIIPKGVGGAYVSCYAAGESYVEATESALKKLASDGLHPEEILQPIHEMPISEWLNHVNEQWREYANNLPSQNEFEYEINSGNVVYGPFGSYNPK